MPGARTKRIDGNLVTLGGSFLPELVASW